MWNKIDLIGLKFGRLMVISESSKRNRSGSVCWLCKCDCGKEIITEGNSLKSGNTTSCGCYNREILSRRKKFNEYILNNDYGIGYTFKKEIFYFDLEDYDKIKDYHWHKSGKGYMCSRSSRTNNIPLLMHRLIMDVEDKNVFIDHINRIRFDNRKLNLRIVNKAESTYNRGLSKGNKSGVTGVKWIEKRNKWRSDITYLGKHIHLGEYLEIYDAIIARLQAEKKYFKKFAPQKHLYEKYGIK